MKSAKKWLLVGFVLLAAGAWWLIRQGNARPPIRHVVLISLDTTRADHLSCYGYDLPTTPNIDALAAEGHLFRNCTTPVPMTLPAHTSMFTGTIPPRHGKHKNGDTVMDPSLPLLASMLQSQGFRTGAFLSAQVLNRSFGLDQGFSHYDDQFDTHERIGEDVNRSAFEWLDQQNPDEDSIFLFMHYFDPHDEYEPPEPFATEYSDHPYAGELAYTDQCVGQVIEKLKSKGMFDSSLIIVTGDHGEMLGEHGELTHMYFIYQSAIRVPMVYRLPGGSPPQTIEDLTSIIDIVPTVCDLLEIDAPVGLQGKNMAGFFRGDPPMPEDRYLYCESTHATLYNANSLIGLVSNDWKYIHTTRPELYNLQDDPGELNNLVEQNARQADILRENLFQVAEAASREQQARQNRPIAPELVRHLQSLGYVGESDTAEAREFDEELEDPKDLVDVHNAWHEATHLVKDGKLREALPVFESVIEQRKEYVFCEFATRICLQMKEYDKAIEYGLLAVEQKPDSFVAREQLAFAYSFAQQDEKAAEQYQMTLDHMPSAHADFRAARARIHFQLGMTRVRQQLYEQAIAQLEEGLQLTPQQPLLLNSLASVLLESPAASRDAGRALGLALQACGATRMQHPGYLKTLAMAHGDLDQFDEAISVTRTALPLASASGDQALVGQLEEQLASFENRQPAPR